MNIYEGHKWESKGVTSLLITPVPQLSVPSFAASKVGSPWLGGFFLLLFFLCVCVWLTVKEECIHNDESVLMKEDHGISADD